MPGVQIEQPQPVTEADVLRVHDAKYVQAVKTGQPRALAEGQKFPWSPQLYPSVLLTSGGCLAAARRALTDGIAVGVVSGFHHSHAEHGEGFCTFNGLVISIDALRALGKLQSAAVFDMDLHYGNGTAQLARSRSYMRTISIYGNDYWNNTAYRDVSVRHHEDGPNHLSFALPDGCDRATMFAIMDQALPKLLDPKPDLILYQAGADPYFEDPYSPLKLDHDDLFERDHKVFQFSRQHSIPLAWLLAGGYTADVSKVVKVHLNTFKAAVEVFGS